MARAAHTSRTFSSSRKYTRPGEAFRPLWPWLELKSAFLSVARQISVKRMAVSNLASDSDLGDPPNQPASFNFLERKFGQSKPVFRIVQPACFNKWPWLDYDQVEDKMFCYVVKELFVGSASLVPKKEGCVYNCWLYQLQRSCS